jgi:hypothetical protein
LFGEDRQGYIATYAKDPKWTIHPGLVEDRETSLLEALKMLRSGIGKRMIGSEFGLGRERREGEFLIYHLTIKFISVFGSALALTLKFTFEERMTGR